MKSLKLKESEAIYSRAVRLIPGASQTGSKRATAFARGAYPIYAQRAKGCRIWDVDGNEYIDYVLGLGPITLGYCYPAVDNAIQRQLQNGIIYGLCHPVEVEAAELVTEVIPGADMVRFFKTGACAVSAAVRVARGVTGREKVISNGYHGWHDTFSATIDTPGVPHALKDLIANVSYNDLDAIKQHLADWRGEVACIVTSPVDYRHPEKDGLLREVRALADEAGAALIFDEIVTGFRLALGGAQEYLGVTADMACFAKGMANGMPVAALAGNREYMQPMQDLLISSTYGGEALSLAAVTAAITECKRNHVPAHMWKMGRRLVDGLNEAAREAGVNARWVGYAPMSAYAFHNDDKDTAERMMTFFLQECAKRGVLVRRGGLMFITYSHTRKEIDKTIEVAAEVMGLMREALDKGVLADRLETQEKR